MTPNALFEAAHGLYLTTQVEIRECQIERLGMTEQLVAADQARRRRASDVLTAVTEEWEAEERKPNNEGLRIAERDRRLAADTEYGRLTGDVEHFTHEIAMSGIVLEGKAATLSRVRREMDYATALINAGAGKDERV